MKNIGLSIIVALTALSLQAIELSKAVAPAWYGPEIETKRRAAEQETDKQRTVAKKEAALVAMSKRPFASMDDAILRQFPHEVCSIIGEYLSPLYCSRTFTIPTFKVPRWYHTKVYESGASACFTDNNKQVVYLVEDTKSGRFRLYNENGTERAYCTSHTKTLTKVFVMPTIEKQERPYKFVTGSYDGTIRFWNENGQEVGMLQVGDKVNDFDIIVDQAFQGRNRDILAVTMHGMRVISVCDISSIDTIYLIAQLQAWGNTRAAHVRLLPAQQGLQLVTNEVNEVRGSREHALCWYDVERRRREMDLIDSTTRIDTIRTDDGHTWVLVGDQQGVVTGLKYNHRTGNLSGTFKKCIAAKKMIVSLKAYYDTADHGSPHALVQAEKDDQIYDLHVDSGSVETFTPVSKKQKFYMGLGHDGKGRSCILTCSKGRVDVWKKDKEPLNYGYFVTGFRQTEHTEVPTASSCCVIL